VERETQSYINTSERRKKLSFVSIRYRLSKKKNRENLSRDPEDKFSLNRLKLHVAELLENRINFGS